MVLMCEGEFLNWESYRNCVKWNFTSKEPNCRFSQWLGKHKAMSSWYLKERSYRVSPGHLWILIVSLGLRPLQFCFHRLCPRSNQNRKLWRFAYLLQSIPKRREEEWLEQLQYVNFQERIEIYYNRGLNIKKVALLIEFFNGWGCNSNWLSWLFYVIKNPLNKKSIQIRFLIVAIDNSDVCLECHLLVCVEGLDLLFEIDEGSETRQCLEVERGSGRKSKEIRDHRCENVFCVAGQWALIKYKLPRWRLRRVIKLSEERTQFSFGVFVDRVHRFDTINDGFNWPVSSVANSVLYYIFLILRYLNRRSLASDYILWVYKLDCRSCCTERR